LAGGVVELGGGLVIESRKTDFNTETCFGRKSAVCCMI